MEIKAGDYLKCEYTLYQGLFTVNNLYQIEDNKLYTFTIKDDEDELWVVRSLLAENNEYARFKYFPKNVVESKLWRTLYE